MTAAIGADWDVDPTHEPTPEDTAAAQASPPCDRWHDLGQELGLIGPEAPVTVTFGEAA